MRKIAVTYAKVLLELAIKEEDIMECKERFEENPILLDTFENPRISLDEKNRVIEKLFPTSMYQFLKTAVINQDTDCMLDIFSIWEEMNRDKKQSILATYRYVTKPTDSQVSRMKEYLKKEYQVEDVELELIEDASLMGGFILQVKDKVIDRSTKGRLRSMRQKIARR